MRTFMRQSNFYAYVCLAPPKSMRRLWQTMQDERLVGTIQVAPSLELMPSRAFHVHYLARHMRLEAWVKVLHFHTGTTKSHSAAM